MNSTRSTDIEKSLERESEAILLTKPNHSHEVCLSSLLFPPPQKKKTIYIKKKSFLVRPPNPELKKALNFLLRDGQTIELKEAEIT